MLMVVYLFYFINDFKISCSDGIVIYLKILGEPTCCTTLPNACSHEEFNGCNGRWIYSCPEQS